MNLYFNKKEHVKSFLLLYLITYPALFMLITVYALFLVDMNIQNVCIYSNICISVYDITFYPILFLPILSYLIAGFVFNVYKRRNVLNQNEENKTQNRFIVYLYESVVFVTLQMTLFYFLGYPLLALYALLTAGSTDNIFSFFISYACVFIVNAVLTIIPIAISFLLLWGVRYIFNARSAYK